MKRNAASREPIFIVGSARSGTTLLAGMLSAHSRMICGPETGFFSGLARPGWGEDLCRPNTWPEDAVNYLFSITSMANSVITEDYRVTREEVTEFLKGRERSLNAILESLTLTNMKRHGKQRWVEKTPIHLRCLAEIRRCYPNAPVIRIIRDPRDVALSALKVPWATATFPVAIVNWQYLDESGASFFQTDRNSISLRYEDLLTSPKEQLTRLCHFIGEDFEPGMLDTSRSVAHVSYPVETWKRKAGEQLDTSRIGVWRERRRPSSSARPRQSPEIGSRRTVIRPCMSSSAISRSSTAGSSRISRI